MSAETPQETILLTENQRRVYALFQAAERQGQPTPTNPEIMERLGFTRGQASGAVFALQRKGLVPARQRGRVKPQLTEKQRSVLAIFEEHKAKGIPAPTNGQIMRRLDFTKGQVGSIILALRTRGLVEGRPARREYSRGGPSKGDPPERAAVKCAGRAPARTCKQRTTLPRVVTPSRSMNGMQHKTCQWINGEPQKTDAAIERAKCGHPVVEGTSWCREHLERVYIPRSQSRLVQELGI